METLSFLSQCHFKTCFTDQPPCFLPCKVNMHTNMFMAILKLLLECQGLSWARENWVARCRSGWLKTVQLLITSWQSINKRLKWKSASYPLFHSPYGRRSAVVQGQADQHRGEGCLTIEGHQINGSCSFMDPWWDRSRSQGLPLPSPIADLAEVPEEEVLNEEISEWRHLSSYLHTGLWEEHGQARGAWVLDCSPYQSLQCNGCALSLVCGGQLSPIGLAMESLCSCLWFGLKNHTLLF